MHVENRIEQLRPLRADEPLALRLWAEDLRPHDRGRQFDVVAEAGGDPALLTPVARGITPAELRFGVRHEGAMNVGDLLERRSRLALVDADRERAEAAAKEALARAE